MAIFPNINPDYSASNDVKPSVLRSKFGDGYEQRVGDGINILPRSWSLVFTRPSTDIDTIENFLIARYGVESFDWTPPRGAAGKWISSDSGWKRSVANFGQDTLIVTLSEVFEP